MFKRVISVLAIIAIIGTGSITKVYANANEGIIITPFWTHILTVSADSSISSAGLANAYASMSANPKTIDNVRIIMTIYKQNSSGSWQSVKSWDESDDTSAMVIDKYQAVSKGEYKFVYQYRAYSGSTLKESTTETRYETY